MLPNAYNFWLMISHHPVGIVWFVLWSVNAYLNARTGWETGDSSLAMAAAFFAVAVLGAIAAAHLPSSRSTQRAGLVVIVGLQLALGQYSGWQTIGLTLSRGAGALDHKAVSRNALSDKIKRLRSEREAIGSVRPVATIEAAAALECKTTSRRYPDGVGPKCTELRQELGLATRARAIETDLPKLIAQQGGGETLTDADAPYKVAQSLLEFVSGTAATSDDVRYWFAIFITLALEFMATLGPPLFGIGGMRQAPVPYVPFDPAALPPVPGALPAPPFLQQLPRPHYQPPGGGAPQGGTYDPHGGGTPGTHSASAHGAPITINLTPGAAGVPASATVDASRSVSHAAATQAAARLPKPRAPRLDVGAQPAQDPPVDRKMVQEAIDGLLAFRAACVAEAAGGLVSAADLYRRYVAWRGHRALAEAAFHSLFSEMTGVLSDDIAGVRHYRDVALRANDPQLRVAG